MSKSIKIIIIIIAVAVLAGGGFVLFNNKNSGNRSTASDTSVDKSAEESSVNQAETENAEIAATIIYTNDGFDPKSVTVPSGSTVAIINQSDNDLEFSSDEHPTHTDQPELNTNRLQPGERTTIRLTQVGDWGFHDHLNSSHTGNIRVE